jgi:hypothetical protein
MDQQLHKEVLVSNTRLARNKPMALLLPVELAQELAALSLAALLALQLGMRCLKRWKVITALVVASIHPNKVELTYPLTAPLNQT